MKFSARSQYALEAMLALAACYDGKPVQVRYISQDHGIPVRFLEQIMASLKKAGLVQSIRGARGGYLLGGPPSTIRVSQVLQAVEGPIQEERAEDGQTPAATRAVHGLWREAQDTVRGLFDAITLEQLLERKRKLEGRGSIMFHI